MEYVYTNELYHHGIKGQKWGVRRYQNPDGTLTAEGKEKIAKYRAKEYKLLDKKYDKKIEKQANKMSKYNSKRKAETDPVKREKLLKKYQKSEKQHSMLNAYKKFEQSTIKKATLESIKKERKHMISVGAAAVGANAASMSLMISGLTPIGFFYHPDMQRERTVYRLNQNPKAAQELRDLERDWNSDIKRKGTRR